MMDETTRFIGVVSASSNSSNCTSPLPIGQNGLQPLSQGSAAFIVIALICGCMAQPPGSLTIGNCNRFWRLSPLSTLTESVIVFCRLIKPAFNATITGFRRRLPRSSSWHLERTEFQGNARLRTTAYALLVERLGNSSNHNSWVKEDLKTPVPPEGDVTSIIDEVATMEHGSTLRPVIIVPMLLQAAKIFVIGGSFWKVKALPLAYLMGWLSIEILLLVVHGKPLSDGENSEVRRILLLNVAQVELYEPSNLDPTEHAVSVPVGEVREGAGSPTRIEKQEQLEQIRRYVAQCEALLNKHVSSQTRHQGEPSIHGPNVRLMFKRNQLGNRFLLILLGFIPLIYEMLFQIIFLSTLVPMNRAWSWLAHNANPFLSMILDPLIGLLLSKLFTRYTSRSPSTFFTFRDWIVFKSMVLILAYFIFYYSDSFASKPAWLDWLG